MNILKPFAMLAIALAASSASAEALTIVSSSDSVLLDTSVLTAKNLTVKPVGSATWNATTGILTDPISGASTTAADQLIIQFNSASGFALYTPGLFGQTKVATLQNFSYNVDTGTLHGDLYTLAGNLMDTDLLTASTLVGGVEFGSTVLDIQASNFALATELVTALGSNAASFQFVADAVKTLNIKATFSAPLAVPEPSAFAMLGVGLVGMSLVARRRLNNAA